MQKYYSNTSLPVVSSDGKLNEPTSTSTKPTSKSTNPNPTLTETSEKQEKGKIKPLQKRNRDEDVPINMPKSTTSEIRLRGVFKKPTADMKQKMMYLKNKLPLTQAQMKKFNIPLKENFKFHYESTELFLQDYKSYIRKFLKQTE